MFEALAAEVRDLEVPLDRPAIVELHAIVDQLQARLHEAMGGFDRRSLWDLDAAVSMKAWLRDHAAVTALWTVLLSRDEHCRFPSCDRPASWCDAHHVIWFSHGGETNQTNLVLLCRRHHRRLHQPGWHAKLRPDRTIQVTDPNGIHRTSHPPGALRPFG